jgi:hypothetical protein
MTDLCNKEVWKHSVSTQKARSRTIVTVSQAHYILCAPGLHNGLTTVLRNINHQERLNDCLKSWPSSISIHILENMSVHVPECPKLFKQQVT